MDFCVLSLIFVLSSLLLFYILSNGLSTLILLFIYICTAVSNPFLDVAWIDG